MTVVEPGGGGGKLVEKEELHETIKMPTDHTLTVHQLQQIVGHHQVLFFFTFLKSYSTLRENNTF